MPLVKQGKFKEYYNQCEEIKEDFSQCHDQYFDENDQYDCMYDVFSEFFYSIDAIYRDAVEMKIKLENLVEIAEQKTTSSIKKCKCSINDMENVIARCKEDFWNVFDALNWDISYVEQETLENYKIFKDR